MDVEVVSSIVVLLKAHVPGEDGVRAEVADGHGQLSAAQTARAADEDAGKSGDAADVYRVCRKNG